MKEGAIYLILGIAMAARFSAFKPQSLDTVENPGQDIPMAERWTEIRFESYRCSSGHTEFDVALAPDQRSLEVCPRRNCQSPLRRLHDVEKPPRRIRLS